ncbi:MAG: aminomethyl-transferring glycine dehydrogenase subunit GcvPA [Candidatus Hodarchaeales archaeon]
MAKSQRFTHPYLPQTEEEIKHMLNTIGIKSIQDLFDIIPEKLRFKRTLDLPESHSEHDTLERIQKILSKNKTVNDFLSFLGAGIYHHYVPSIVGSILSRSEFYTAYTPYAPEISQGMLQALWEYQSMVAELTQLDLVNSSMYDQATALGEAALMCTRVNNRDVFLVPAAIQPERFKTLLTYTSGAKIEVRQYPYDPTTGAVDINRLDAIVKDLNGKLSGIYVENPNFFGVIENNISQVGNIAHEADALFVVGFDPISLGLLKSPGDYGADIAIGEGQSLGLQMNFGGPLLGLFAVKNDRKISRSMPGRIIGLTTEKESQNRAFTMTLQTREQHIRRERATSNICTNNALCALASCIYLSALGPKGLENLAKSCFTRTNYMIDQLSNVEFIESPIFSGTHFKEFVFRLHSDVPSSNFQSYLLNNSVFIGVPLKGEYPSLGNTYLTSTTELTNFDDIDRLRTLLEKFEFKKDSE